MELECIDNSKAENQLTVGRVYTILRQREGGLYEIMADHGFILGFNAKRFKVPEPIDNLVWSTP